MVEISVPSYGGSYETYYTSNYVEKDGCIEFIDGFNMNHKICGSYTITKW